MSSNLLDQLIDPIVGCLTVKEAERLLALRADVALQHRVDELAERPNHGTLAVEEQGEFDRFLAAFHLVTLMQARACRPLNAARGPGGRRHTTSRSPTGRGSLRVLPIAPGVRAECFIITVER